MSSFSVATLQEKLSRLSASQESIETLSLWIIHHKAFGKTSVGVWAASLISADPDHRLVLLYLANDVLQNSRRKGVAMFTDLFREPLEQVVPHMCGQKIQSSVERMFRIWRERKVYDKIFVRRLDTLLSSGKSGQEEVSEETAVNVTTPPPEPLADFKLSLLEDAVQELNKFHGEMRVKEASVNSLPMEVWDASSLSILKDKSEGEEFSGRFDKAWATLKDYSDCLGIEVNERVSLSNMLTSCVTEQARQLERVEQDLKVYRKLMEQLKGCREKLSARQKDLERAQQTATSDPSCKDDLTEVGDMEIDSEEETMESQHPPPPSSSLTTNTPLLSADSAPLFTSPPVIPPQMNPAPRIIGVAPPMMNSQPVELPYQQQPFIADFQRFPHPPFPLPSQPRPPMVSPQQQGILGSPPTALPLRFPFGSPRQGGGPQLRGNMGPPPPRVMVPLSNIRPPGMEGGSETHIESPHPMVYGADQEVKSSLDDRLQSLVGRKSLGSVLLQEYTESEDSGEHPYTPTNMPLPSSPGGAEEPDDESVTTPTPQVDESPPTPPDDGGQPKFNPANPIMQALYCSPDDSAQKAGPAGDQNEPAAGSDKGMLMGLDTGMLQTILKNVHDLKTPPTDPPPLSSSLTTGPSPVTSDPPSHTPPLSTSSSTPEKHTPAITTTTMTTTSLSPATNIKITSSLTSLLDEIFPQLSKTLQERKRKQEGPTEEPNKQPRLLTSDPGPVRPPLVRPNGPRPPNGALSPRPPLPHPLGPRGPPGMVLRRPPPEVGGRPLGMRMIMRPRGPPFEGPFRLRGPPRLDGNFRPLGPPRPGFMGPRPPHPFPRMPPQNFSQSPFRPRMGNPGMGNLGMGQNHFPEKPPQSHDSLQSTPPPGMGMWP